MIFHENCLPADDSHEISFLIFFSKIRKDVAKFVVCCSHDFKFQFFLLFFSKITNKAWYFMRIFCHQQMILMKYHSLFSPKYGKMSKNLSSAAVMILNLKFSCFFSKITNKAWYFMRIVCQQMIFIKYHSLFFPELGKMPQNLSSAAVMILNFKLTCFFQK